MVKNGGVQRVSKLASIFAVFVPLYLGAECLQTFNMDKNRLLVVETCVTT
jgi:hypothetical protein